MKPPAASGPLLGLRAANLAFAAAALLLVSAGCRTAPKPGAAAPHRGDEIVAAGQFFHTGTRVVLWMEPGGYDAYRVERRFGSYTNASWEASQRANPNLTTPNRYGLRGEKLLTATDLERVRGGGWDLPLLQDIVDQFVLHYDGSGTSRQCFTVLQDQRNLSVHFLLDLDGTVYQTLDLKERAWHATTSNTRSVGIEIANVGAYPPNRDALLHQWYRSNDCAGVRIVLPERLGNAGLRTPGFVARPTRPEPVRGVVQGQELVQYDFTPEQYRALVQLTATLCKVFPKIKCDYPRNTAGALVTHKLADDQLDGYGGVLGHFHIQTNKVDPGPAFQWARVIDGTRQLLHLPPAPGHFFPVETASP
jgi:N-acetyl-anhydromuramyl-L-alanine amidase AmpD